MVHPRTQLPVSAFNAWSASSSLLILPRASVHLDLALLAAHPFHLEFE